jgi:hypothetical protein
VPEENKLRALIGELVTMQAHLREYEARFGDDQFAVTDMNESEGLSAFICDLETMKAHLVQHEAEFKASAMEVQSLINRLKVELDSMQNREKPEPS